MVAEQERLLDQYCDLLLHWNSRVRLTGFHTKSEIQKNLIFEPASASRYFSLQNDPFPLVDLGSGNGSPGIIFAILNPARPIFLIERRQKKMTFLLYAAGNLKLSNVHVLEDITMIKPYLSGSQVDIWSKAVSWEDLLKACLPLLPLYSPIRIRKFGEDLPSLTCSSMAVHGITFKDFKESGQSGKVADFYVSEALLSGQTGL